MKKRFIIVFLLIALGCQPVKIEHDVKPIEIKPIHITIDVNVKIDKDLDEFFTETQNASEHNKDLLYIQSLVSEGYAKENDRGYIDYFGGDSLAKKLIGEENKRRKNQYQKTADEQNTSIEAVEKNAGKKSRIAYRSGGVSFHDQASESIGPNEINRKGKFYALIIGIKQYYHFSKLETPLNDVTEINSILKTNYGFETILLTDHNATRINIIKTLNKLRKILTKDDSLMIYYAGHGDLIEGKAYWLPIDAQKDDDTNWIIVDKITAILKRLKANHVLVVADSCYSGAFRKGASSPEIPDIYQAYYIKKLMNRKSRILLSSGGKEPVSDVGKNGHSVFANAFISGLNNIEKPVFTVDELFVNWIREPVAGNSTHTPTNEKIENSGHEGGIFIFFKDKSGD